MGGNAKVVTVPACAFKKGKKMLEHNRTINGFKKVDMTHMSGAKFVDKTAGAALGCLVGGTHSLVVDTAGNGHAHLVK